MFHIFFLENFIDGIIGYKTPPKHIYKGGYGRGEGVPPHTPHHRGRVIHILCIHPPLLDITYSIHTLRSCERQ